MRERAAFPDDPWDEFYKFSRGGFRVCCEWEGSSAGTWILAKSETKWVVTVSDMEKWRN